METLRLEVCHRSILLDQRPFIFITEEGDPVHQTTTRGVVELVERHVRRRLRGRARDYGLAQLLGSLRQFNSTKSADDCSQFVVVEPSMVERLKVLEGPGHQVALEEAIVQSVQARHPVDHLAIERWARRRGLWVGLTGKNQVLGGKVRLTTEGLVTDFEPNKLVARSLLDKPEAFRGPSLRVLVVDDPFVDQVTGDGAFLLRASAARDCSRLVTQRVRRTLDYGVNDAKRGQAYLHLGEDEVKLARHDTEILSVREDGDLLWIEKRERARIDTGAKLVHEKGFKATAIVVDRLPEHIERDWPSVDAVTNSSTIKSDALVYGLAQEVLWGEFQRGFIVHLPVRMLFTGEERVSRRGNRVSLNVLSTLNTVSPAVRERMVEARVDEGPGAVIHALLWWADHLKGCSEENTSFDALDALPSRLKAELREDWGDQFERRLAFGDLADHPILDPEANPTGFVASGRGGNRVLVPSARVLLSTLGHVEVDGDRGFWFPDYVNTVLQVVRMLDVRPEKFRRALGQLRDNVLAAVHALRKGHSIRVPGLHGVLVAVKGLGETVVVPDGTRRFRGTIHGEPTMNRDGIRSADVVPLVQARERVHDHPGVRYLLDHLVGDDFHVVLADFDRLTRMNRDNDGDLVYLSRIPASDAELKQLDVEAGEAPRFVDPEERFEALAAGFTKLGGDHEPFHLSPETVHRAVLETAGSARDVGSITLWKYTVQEALVHAGRDDLLAPVARIVQAYVDGMKGAHQTSANLFAALMRVWSRMAVPCVSVKDEEGVVQAVRLAPNLARELRRAGYVDGRDFHSEVAVPHTSLLDEVYRKIKAPLVEILEAILGDLERQSLARRVELVAIRDILESQYGRYPSFQVQDRSSLVAERTQAYNAVQRLYGMRSIRSRSDLEAVGVRPIWGELVALTCSPGGGAETLERMADRALRHGVRPERIEF